ncbi:MAG: hypothetical protein HKN47_28960 [Pirellulaceae bacterium]|nr:hypothetical protein [Pirellulaceae bacterium]
MDGQKTKEHRLANSSCAEGIGGKEVDQKKDPQERFNREKESHDESRN